MLVSQGKARFYESFSDQHRYWKWLYRLISHYYHRYHSMQLSRILKLKIAAPQPTETVRFYSDNLQLVSDVYLPCENPTASTIVLLHGSSVFGRKLTLMRALAQEMRSLGYAVFVFDMRGYGESQDPSEYTLKNFDFAQDVVSAVDYLKTHYSEQCQNLYVFGHSWGGAVALAAQARDSRIQKTISFGPPRRLSERFLNPEAKEKKKLLMRWQADMQLNRPISFNLWQQVLQPLNIENYVDAFAQHNQKPIFLVDAENEPTADLEFLRAIYQQSSSQVDYWTAPETDHYLGSGYLFGIPCYDPKLVSSFVEHIHQWLTTSR